MQLTLTIVPLRADGGRWCERCERPAAVAMWAAVMYGDAPVSIINALRCTECGHQPY